MSVRLYCAALLVLSLDVSGCSEPTNSSVSVPADSMSPMVFNASGAPTVEFSVPDMMCPDSCAVATREILAAQPGAKEVLVDFDSKSAIVAVEEGTFNADEALAALVDRGFDNSTLKSDAAPAEKANL